MANPVSQTGCSEVDGGEDASETGSDDSRTRGAYAPRSRLYGRGGGPSAPGLGRDGARARTQLRDEAPRPHAPARSGARAPARRDHPRVSSTTSTIAKTS